MAQQSQIGKTATTIHTTEQGQTQVIYHSTPVVSFNHKLIILNHGGWMTNTTRTRMNQASNQFNLGYTVFQKDWNWYVKYGGETIPFEERTLELKR